MKFFLRNVVSEPLRAAAMQHLDRHRERFTTTNPHRSIARFALAEEPPELDLGRRLYSALFELLAWRLGGGFHCIQPTSATGSHRLAATLR
jgi:hypothetical protein